MNMHSRRDSSAPQRNWGRGDPTRVDTEHGTQEEPPALTHLEEGTQDNYMSWTGHCQEC
jgi:hypothetical protein